MLEEQPSQGVHSAMLRHFVQYPNGATASYEARGVGGRQFSCYGCTQSYWDAPSIRIRYQNAELDFCTESCALDEGFAEAVEAYLETEIEGRSQDFVWEDYRYDSVSSIA